MTETPAAQLSAAQTSVKTAATRYAFLGPFGTFTELALRQFLQAEGVTITSNQPEEIEAATGLKLLPCRDVGQALKMVREGEADRAVIPLENSVEGGVNASLDALVHGEPLQIVGETAIPIDFCLVVREGIKPEQVRRVGTHPHAWAQCRNWIEDHFPGTTHVPATSTAAAANLLTEDRYPGFEAALCNAVAAQTPGLVTLADGIADNPNAVTRFVLVSRPGRTPAPTGADKTTVQVRLPDNEAGALLNMLEQFSARGVNLSRIESRPGGGRLGTYEFSVDIEGHIAERRVQAALTGLHRTCPQVRFVGSYPRFDAKPNTVETGTEDSAFEAATAWVESLLTQD
ncbi:prephenate dehydratase [Boudabousia tangfeifanii]|uniref:Prephenate dehydratase n=1 Tax=Boudabousia tangfeifanii TaxID=1912795 RepID=A0A1D9MI70_9ACTO|nr:prephenate dehydratase [Boudabousia tangfeifanii]AOZ71997.1 prephenate dehydratase [Boudabousia tangfeifanii]